MEYSKDNKVYKEAEVFIFDEADEDPNYKVHIIGYNHYADFELFRLDGQDNTELNCQGFVKWDGCCNVYIGNRDIMMHFCYIEEMQSIFKAILKVREMIGEYIYQYDVNVTTKR